MRGPDFSQEFYLRINSLITASSLVYTAVHLLEYGDESPRRANSSVESCLFLGQNCQANPKIRTRNGNNVFRFAMPAKDLYHDTVVQALINDGWEITDHKTVPVRLRINSSSATMPTMIVPISPAKSW